jgi:hypothetical protein
MSAARCFARSGIRALAAVVFAATLAAPAQAQGTASNAPAPSSPRYKFSGLMFGDYYYFSQEHDPAWEHQQGFWFRRIYFTLDYTFSPTLSTRFRLEVNSDGGLDGGPLTPFVKDAYLRWVFYRRQRLLLGIQPTQSIDAVQSVWSLRYIEKTPLEIYKWDSSRDNAIAIGGPMNPSTTLSYSLQFGNESGVNAETDRFKTVRATVRYQEHSYESPTGLIVEGLVARFARADHADRTMLQAFAGYTADRVRVGVHYTTQRRNAAAGTSAPALKLDLVSGFAVVQVKPQKWGAFARVDRSLDPCPDCAGIDYLPIDTGAPFTLLIAGAEYYLHPSVRFSPNVEWVAYSNPPAATTAKPRDDVVWRATFYWIW